MKKFILSAVVMLIASLQAFCDAPNGWETQYFNMGAFEYCGAELEGGLEDARVDLYKDAVVVCYESEAKMNGALTLTVGDFSVQGKQGEYGTVNFVIKGPDTIQKFIAAVGDGSTPFTITAGNTTQTVKLPAASAATLTKAVNWVKTIHNGLKSEDVDLD